MIWGDYHTHTRFSHGKGKIKDNVKAANIIELKEVGISDHGLRHIAFGIKTNEIFRMRSIIDKLQKNSQTAVKLGIEANIFSSDGDIDLRKVEKGYFDFIIAGYHKGVWAKNFKDMFKFSIPAINNDMFGCTQHSKKIFTEAYIKAIKTQKIDIISHMNLGIQIDILEVGKACRDYNVLVELNGKRVMIPDDDILALAAKKTMFILSSDAHTPDRVGDVSVPLAVVERLQIDKSLIANWEQIPVFNNKRTKF